MWRAYYGQMERLARDIMRIFAVALELPERFLQSRQWHRDTRTGSPVAVAFNCPQRQEAV